MNRRSLTFTLILVGCFVLLAGGVASAAPLPVAQPAPTPATAVVASPITPPPGQVSETLTLIATDDTYIDSTQPDANFGDSPQLKINNGANTYAAVLLKFDESRMPATAYRYTLSLEVDDSPITSAWAYHVSPYFPDTTVPWTEHDLTWNNAAPTSHGGSTTPVAYSEPTGIGLRWDVTDVVATHGSLAFEVGHGTMTFMSKEGEYPNWAAKLTIDYWVDAPTVHTLTPTDDATVAQRPPKANFGDDPTLDVINAYTDKLAYLKFDLSALSDIKRATLRLYTNEGGGGSHGWYPGVYSAAGSWDESTVNWTNAPLIGAYVGLTYTYPGEWTEVDVTAAALTAPQKRLTLALSSTDRDAFSFSSKEGAHPPQLVVETDGGVLLQPIMLTYTPTNDTFVSQAQPRAIMGRRTGLMVRNAAKDMNTYIKFNLIGLTGTIESATLTLYAGDGGPDGGDLYLVSPTYPGTTKQWLETDMNWLNAPPLLGQPLANLGPVLRRGTVSVDLTEAARAAVLNENGRLSLALHSHSNNRVVYSSKEGVRPPELTVYMTP